MPEPTWSGKVVLLNDALAQSGVLYAFGGAIALNYHREPRATLDINIFVSPADRDEVLAVLTGLYGLPDRGRVEHALDAQGQARSLWGETYVDLFFANTEFHDSMATWVERQPFDGREVPVLSIEDLVVCKVLFDRPKDWLDIAAVARTERADLDMEYIKRWVLEFVEPYDGRFTRLDEAVRPN